MSSRPLAVIAALMLLIARPTHAQQDFTVAVDARETARGILHVKQTFPAKPGGTLALSYPQWIPGEHGPTGPNVDVAGLFPRAGERILSWSRDPVNINTIRIAVPAGVRSVDLSFDFLLDNGTSGFTSAACATPNLLLLSWNQVAFYPAGKRSDDLRVAATLQLPDRWSHASALDELPAQGAAIAFAPCTLTRLVDSPVLSGEHMRTVELTAPGDSVPVRLRMACDSEVGLGIKDAQVTALKQLVKEARALFGTQHYRHYDFLLTLSDHVAQFGLEHRQSSDDHEQDRSTRRRGQRAPHRERRAEREGEGNDAVVVDAHECGGLLVEGDRAHGGADLGAQHDVLQRTQQRERDGEDDELVRGNHEAGEVERVDGKERGKRFRCRAEDELPGVFQKQ